MGIADLCADTGGENGADAGDGGEADDGSGGVQLARDPGFHLLHLAFEEADVRQGQFEDALDRQGQGMIEGEAFGATRCSLRAWSCGWSRWWPLSSCNCAANCSTGSWAKWSRAGCWVENQAAGHAKQVRERLDPAIGAGFEEQESREVAFLPCQVLDDVETEAGVEAQRQARWWRPRDTRAAGARPLGDVEGVLLIALVVLGEALLEPVHPARIERVELDVVGFQVGIGGELEEEGEPVIAGGFPGDVQAVAVVLVESLEQQSFLARE